MQVVASHWSYVLWTCRAAMLFIPLSTTACHEWRTENLTPTTVLATRQLVTLRVTRIDGSQVVLEHPLLQRDTLSGDTVPSTRPDTSVLRDVHIPLTDVRQVATRDFSAGRTVGLGLGVAAGLAAAWGVFVAIFLASCDTCH